MYYPIFLNLRNKECLVVGAGGVGKRKILSLCDAKPGKIVVIDPHVSVELEKDLPDFVEIKKRSFKEQDLKNKFLVIVATDDMKLNQRISNLCNEKNILCNVVDKPELCSFIVPAIIQKGSIKIAVSTGGKSPAVARYIKSNIKNAVGDEIVILTEILGRIRAHVISMGKSSSENKKVFNSLIEDKFIKAIKNRDKNYIADRLNKILLNLSKKEILELIDDVF